jgi:hypothetical protein
MKAGATAVFAFLMFAATSPSPAQLREYPDESLRRIQGVRVVVRYQAPSEAAYGLTEDRLRAAVEARLAADNVRVLDETAWRQEPGEPCLFINVVGTQVDSSRKSHSPFVYSFSADLIQKVSLDRLPAFTSDAATWSQGYFLVVPREELRSVTLQISNVAHDFAESVHLANPVSNEAR